MILFWKIRLISKWIYKHSLCYLFGAIWGYCKICGKRERPCFTVSNDLWTEVTGYPSDTAFTCCINCFDRLADKKGYNLLWTTKAKDIFVRSKQ